MSTITHHIPVTTGQAHHMTLRLHLSYGAPAPIADYAIYGSILQDGETVPISAAVSDTSDIQLTIPPLTPGVHPYTLHIHNKYTGTDHLILQGNCNVSELIDGDASDTENRERITATLNADLSGITVTMQIGDSNNASPQLDMEAILTDPEFLQRFKEACGILDMEKTLAAKANQSDMDAALVKKADITTLEAGLASKADTSTLTNYIPYAKIGRSLTKTSDGKVDVDLANYTGSVVNIVGTTSACIGRSATERLEVTEEATRLRHNSKSEILRGNTCVNVTTGAFVLKTGSGSTDATIYAQTNLIGLDAKDQVAMRALSGNCPGLFLRGTFSTGAFNDLQMTYNSTSTYIQIARFKVSGHEINAYTYFANGHN